MNRCYICEDLITEENQTLEHIILNSIGGKLKSKKLICKNCNIDLGSTIDNTLAQQLNHIANLLDIDRDRGKPQPIIGENESNNEKWLMESGGKPYKGKPIYKEDIIENGVKRISIQARSKSEAKKMIKGVARKYPDIDVEQILQLMVNSREYLDNKVHFTFTLGGQETFRSVCKTAVNYYIFCGGQRKVILHLIPFIKDNIENNYVWYFYDDNEIIEKESKQILHSIVLIGDPEEKILFAYIDFFNIFKFIVLLNDDYQEEEIKKTYIYDILECKEISKKVHLKLYKKDIISLINNKPRPEANLKKHYEKILPIIMEKMNNDQINDMLSIAFHNFSKKYPEGNEKMDDELIIEIIKEIKPWLMHNLKNGNIKM